MTISKIFYSFPLVFMMSMLLMSCVSGGMLGNKTGGKPLPDLTFDHIVPVQLTVSDIAVQNNYDPARDEKDVSSNFPTPPDILLRRYADKKFSIAQLAQNDGRIFTFIIEDASIHETLIEPDNKLLKWVRMGGKNRYDVAIKLRMFTTDIAGQESAHSVLTFKRYISIPQSYSLNEKELEQFGFLELLMKDVDEAVTISLRDKIGIAL